MGLSRHLRIKLDPVDPSLLPRAFFQGMESTRSEVHVEKTPTTVCRKTSYDPRESINPTAFLRRPYCICWERFIRPGRKGMHTDVPRTSRSTGKSSSNSCPPMKRQDDHLPLRDLPDDQGSETTDCRTQGFAPISFTVLYRGLTWHHNS